jgi:hypothetical protein
MAFNICQGINKNGPKGRYSFYYWGGIVLRRWPLWYGTLSDHGTDVAKTEGSQAVASASFVDALGSSWRLLYIIRLDGRIVAYPTNIVGF